MLSTAVLLTKQRYKGTKVYRYKNTYHSPQGTLRQHTKCSSSRPLVQALSQYIYMASYNCSIITGHVLSKIEPWHVASRVVQAWNQFGYGKRGTLHVAEVFRDLSDGYLVPYNCQSDKGAQGFRAVALDAKPCGGQPGQKPDSVLISAEPINGFLSHANAKQICLRLRRMYKNHRYIDKNHPYITIPMRRHKYFSTTSICQN